MKALGADLVVKALEAEGVRFTFGIPGTHNFELYDALERSEQITPVLVTDEQSGAFMADGMSRTSDSIGVLNIVPGAGVSHALSGIAEAWMDNIPLLVLTCGIRNDTGKVYQLHDVDQLAFVAPVTKATYKIDDPSELYPTVREAIQLARSGTPGPVAVEVPANYYVLAQKIDERPVSGAPAPPQPQPADIEAAVRMLNEARQPALYIGNGAQGATELLTSLAEKLSAPVSTTVQGKGVFPEDHPLWLWPGFGAAAPSFVRSVFDRVDVLLAIGCRFGEVATASYGLNPPEQMIHVDINGEVFQRNYPAALAVESDAATFLDSLLPRIKERPADAALADEIATGHAQVEANWERSRSNDRVTPHRLLRTIQQVAGPETVYATDSGNGTFLAMELLRLTQPGTFIAPVDYSCMGYCVPARVGAKFARPNSQVVGLAGDGALLMTGLELLTASHYGLNPIVFVLQDGELGQIAQFSRTTLNTDTCCVLASLDLERYARAVHAEFLSLPDDAATDEIVRQAFELSGQGRPVVVQVSIDYSQKTYFTRGVVKTNFWRLPWSERLRITARAIGRRLPFS